MKYIIAMICAGVLCTGAFVTEAQNRCKVKHDQTLLLYPEGQLSDKGLEGASGPLKSNGHTSDKEVEAENGNLTLVGDNARIELFFPKKPNGQMVLICPGGGYWKVAAKLEGLYVAEWLLKHGIAACVISYRVPEKIHELPLRDVHNAFRYCRAHASEWGIDQFGIMGFSAGGHLAASASNLYVDDATKPDFSILIYPVISFDSKYGRNGTRDHLLGKAEEWEDKDAYQSLVKYYSMDERVTSETPATFIACCMDDKSVPVVHSMDYYRSLLKCKVSSELHIYPSGGHGWGFSYERFNPKGKDKFAYARGEFENSLLRWLEGLRK